MCYPPLTVRTACRSSRFLGPLIAVAILACGVDPSGPVGAADPPATPGRIDIPRSAHWNPRPRVWRYEVEGRKLAFFPTHNGWLEIAKDVVLAYHTFEANGDSLELARGNPPVRVRLLNDRCDVSVRGGDFFTVHRGSWSDEGYPFPRAIRLAGQGGIRFPQLQGVFRQGQPFVVEMWLRPNADPPPGAYPLVHCGPTTVNWEIQSDGPHRIVVRTQGKNFMFVAFKKLAADWSVLHFGHDGKRVFLAFNGNGMAHLDTDFLSDDAGMTPLTIGGARPETHGLWADIAAFRFATNCPLTAEGAADAKSLPLHPRLEVPTAWDPDQHTQVLLDLTGKDRLPVTDRSGRKQPLEISLGMIDVLTAPPFLATGLPTIAKPTTPGSGGKPAPPTTAGPSPLPVASNKPMSPGVADAPAVVRRPPPTAAESAQQVAQVREIFKTSYEQSRKPADKAALAAKLADHARKTGDDPPAQFVLWDESRRLYAEAGQAVDACARIDEIASSFDVDALAMQLIVLRQVHELLAASAGAPLDLRTKTIEVALALSSAAQFADRFDLADALAEVAVRQANTSQVSDGQWLRRAREHARFVSESRQAWQTMATAAERLQTVPDDPDAHHIVGCYLGFHGGLWTRALEHLERSSVVDVAAAAKLDQAAGHDPQLRMKAALAWEQAANLASEVRRGCQGRALECWQAALDSLKGLDKELARKHIDQLGSLAVPMPPSITLTLPDGSTKSVIPGMIGKAYLGERDLGVVVTLRPGAPLSQVALNRILADAKAKGPLRIELAGFLLPLESTLTVRCASAGKSSVCFFWDGAPYSKPESGSAHEDRLTVSPAPHAVAWKLDNLDSNSKLRLTLTVGDRGTPIMPFHTRAMLEAACRVADQDGEFRKVYDLSGDKP